MRDMKTFRRVFRWLTLISLILWAGVAWHVVRQQATELPPRGWPETYTDCVATWGKDRPQVATRCATYYAVLGDRSAPWLRRLQQQTQGRIIEKVMATYLQLYPPQPGEMVDGKIVLSRLGAGSIAPMVYEAIREAKLPPTTARRAHERCLLEETRKAPEGTPNIAIQQRCPMLR